MTVRDQLSIVCRFALQTAGGCPAAYHVAEAVEVQHAKLPRGDTPGREVLGGVAGGLAQGVEPIARLVQYSNVIHQQAAAAGAKANLEKQRISPLIE